MSVTEKISAYFDQLESEDKLRPGDKLPKYAEICEMFDISYTSAQRAFKKLEQMGKIKIVHGVGSFLNGGDMLDVDFYLQKTMFDFNELEKILAGISEEHNLNLNIVLKDRYLKKELPVATETHKVIITESDPWVKMHGVLMDFSSFPDYRDLVSEFWFNQSECSNLQLPFYYQTTQGAVNPLLLKKIGFENRITELSDLKWWDEFAAACQRKGIVPGIKNYFPDSLWSFPVQSIAEIVIANERKSVKELFQVPFFLSKAGEQIFKIMNDLKYVKNEQETFLSGVCALSFNAYSWISVQYGRHLEMFPESFQIIPKMCGDRHLLPYVLGLLQVFVNHTVTEAEKKRIWIFLKELLSRENQKKLVAASGMISPRKDMKREDHAWALREDFRWFFPQQDTIFLSQEILRKEEVASLAALFEQYEIYGADQKMIRGCMDKKLAVMQNK